MKKIRILFVMHELSIGGAERVVTNIMNNLDKEKFDVHLCLFKKKGDLLKSLSKDVTVHNLCASRVSRGFFRLLLLIVSLRPDIVFSGITHVNLLISMQITILKILLRDVKFISREVNIPSVRAVYLTKSKKMDILYKKLVHNFDKVIAQSVFMKNDLKESYQLTDDTLMVINNPIDFEAIKNKLALPEKVSFKHKDKINILSVGRLRYQKGFDILVEIMLHLDEHFHLNILGEGDQRETLEAKISELGLQEKVSLLGFSDNPYKYMMQADIIVSSSRYEGFPNVILESNACGKFVIAFSCPGVGSEIIKNNLNGVLVEHNNVQALAEAVRKYSKINHDREKIIMTTEAYKVENIIKKYNNLFFSLKNRL